MGWNSPDKNEKSPWGGSGKPPDLDAALKQLQKKMNNFFGSLFARKKSKKSKNKSSATALGAIVLMVLFLFWLMSGIFIVGPAEKAVVLRFGQYVGTVGPGPHWIPRLICSKNVVNVDRVADYSYSAQMLTRDENLVSVAVAVQYRIGSLKDYLFNVVAPEESLQQATSSALRQVVGSTTLDQIITEGREAWGISVREALIKILKDYQLGIVIVNVSPQPARAPESVQDAFDDAIKAQEDEKRFKEQARAYEARVVPIAMGNARRIRAEAHAFAEQVVLQAKGETAEFLSLLPEYLRSPFVMSERMYFDTLQTVLTQSSKVIVDLKGQPVLYLPIEGNASNRTVVDLSKTVMGDGGSLDKAIQQKKSFDGRSTIRPTENFGGVLR